VREGITLKKKYLKGVISGLIVFVSVKSDRPIKIFVQIRDPRKCPRRVAWETHNSIYTYIR
jgi:hypothetical protein